MGPVRLQGLRVAGGRAAGKVQGRGRGAGIGQSAPARGAGACTPAGGLAAPAPVVVPGTCKRAGPGSRAQLSRAHGVGEGPGQWRQARIRWHSPMAERGRETVRRRRACGFYGARDRRTGLAAGRNDKSTVAGKPIRQGVTGLTKGNGSGSRHTYAVRLECFSRCIHTGSSHPGQQCTSSFAAAPQAPKLPSGPGRRALGRPPPGRGGRRRLGALSTRRRRSRRAAAR
jgi:hypothetical protein